MAQKTKDIKFLMKHVDVQSLLDIKAFFGEFSFECLNSLYDSSEYVHILKEDTPYAGFFLVKTKDGYNMFSLLTPKAFVAKGLKQFFDTYICQKNILTLVYKGNKRFYNMLTSFGFVPVKEIKEGVEKRTFVLLKRG